MTIRSAQFDDIYFSQEDGLAETRHVFLDGNNLPVAWSGRDRFCIAELGFGTGLNVLAAWKLFEETAGDHQRLDIVSIEKYPLTKMQIKEALAVWAPDLGDYLDRLVAAYPIMVPGFHQIHLSPRVTLTLILDDIRTALEELEAHIDVWFLDGFAPAKNPDMWSDDVFTNMARLSNSGATFATFTAAGHVRRGLSAAGFDVSKTRGYGRKRDMTVGCFTGQGRSWPVPSKRVAVIGAGIAGASAAWHLRRSGVDVQIYDAAPSIASGASGNQTGLMNPKLTVQRGAQSDYYTAAYAYALRILAGIDSRLFQCGSLHLQTDEDRARRFHGYVSNLGWAPDHMRLLDATQASDIASVNLNVPCLFYPDAAVVSPKGTVKAMLHDIPVHLGIPVTDASALDADTVIYATAHDGVSGLDLRRVRGQVSCLLPSLASAPLKTNLCYGGYLSPVGLDGTHMCGATFQPWDEDPAVRTDDHARNLENLAQAVPGLQQGLKIVDGWTGFRAASRDRFPAIGQYKNAWVSVAHGSHGMISGVMGGAILAAQITGAPLPMGRMVLNALAPGRLDSPKKHT